MTCLILCTVSPSIFHPSQQKAFTLMASFFLLWVLKAFDQSAHTSVVQFDYSLNTILFQQQQPTVPVGASRPVIAQQRTSGTTTATVPYVVVTSSAPSTVNAAAATAMSVSNAGRMQSVAVAAASSAGIGSSAVAVHGYPVVNRQLTQVTQESIVAGATYRNIAPQKSITRTPPSTPVRIG